MKNSMYNELDRKINKLENKVNRQAAMIYCDAKAKDTIYACERCNKVFDDFNQLEVHAFFKHNAATCPVCLTQYSSHQAYRSLITTGDFFCKTCQHSFRE